MSADPMDRSAHDAPPGTPSGPAGAGVVGLAGFTVVSIAAFSVWAFAGGWFYRNLGEAGLYAACAVVFLGLSGLLLHPLVIGPRRLARFYKVFLPAFGAYAVVWCIAWFAWKGRGGEWLGSAAGSAALCWVVTRAFGNPAAFGRCLAVVFVTHSIGYFAGDEAMRAMLTPPANGVWEAGSRAARGVLAKLCWGALYGAGFGAGLGYCFHAAQGRDAPAAIVRDGEADTPRPNPPAG